MSKVICLKVIHINFLISYEIFYFKFVNFILQVLKLKCKCLWNFMEVCNKKLILKNFYSYLFKKIELIVFIKKLNVFL